MRRNVDTVGGNACRANYSNALSHMVTSSSIAGGWDDLFHAVLVSPRSACVENQVQCVRPSNHVIVATY